MKKTFLEWVKGTKKKEKPKNYHRDPDACICDEIMQGKHIGGGFCPYHRTSWI